MGPTTAAMGSSKGELWVTMERCRAWISIGKVYEVRCSALWCFCCFQFHSHCLWKCSHGNMEMLSAVHYFRAADEVWGDLLPKVITALFLLNINEKVISAATLL